MSPASMGRQNRHGKAHYRMRYGFDTTIRTVRASTTTDTMEHGANI